MSEEKRELVPVDGNGRMIQIQYNDARGTSAAFDEAIRAQLMQVAVGVIGTGGIGSTTRMLVDLLVYISLDHLSLPAQSKGQHGVLFAPVLKTQAGAHDAHLRDHADMLVPRWSRVCTQLHVTNSFHCDLKPSVGDAFTLRLLFDAQGERHASEMVDTLCTGFAAWHQAKTSLREAMATIAKTLTGSRAHHYAPAVLYRSASVCKGWTQKIIDPTSFLCVNAFDDDWSVPRVPHALGDLFAERCEAVWSETAKTLQAPEPKAESADEVTDLADSNDAADDYVCADRMLSLWYGSKRRRR